MTPEAILKHLKERPFRPFRVTFLDGVSYDIRHPEMAMISERTFLVATGITKKGLVSDMSWCAPDHVVRIELINGQSNKAKPRARKKD